MVYNPALNTLNMTNDSRCGMNFRTKVNLKLSWKKPLGCSLILSAKFIVLNYALMNIFLKGL